MTIRHRVRVIALAGALATGGVAVAPFAISAAAAQAPVIHHDALAGVAANALDNLVQFRATGDVTARDAYAGDVHTLAIVVAARLDVDPSALEAAWRAADPAHQQALMAALSQLGVPYHRLASQPGIGFDCSGLTSYAWAQAGLTIAHQSGSQIRAAAPRTAETAQAGDLVFYPGHVMMSLGLPGTIVHAPYTGRTVEVDHVTTGRRTSVRYGDPTA